MEDNPFLGTFAGDEAQSAPAAPPAPTPQPDANNPFLQNFADEQAPPIETGAPGAFMHHAERGIVPSITGMTGAGMGAEVGAEVGGAGGAFVAGPPGAVVGGVLGGLTGGLVGFMGGDQAMSAAQDWLIKQLPESWQELLGQSEKQRAAEEQEQPIASQIGTLAPFVLTMRSSLIGPRAPAPAADASILRRVWNSPVTAPILSAAMQGGTEAVSEVTSGQKIDPSRIAIATAFGLMFDRPTALGERLTMLGEKPIRMITGRGEPVPVAPREEETPTVAQAADAQVLGPGITEGVFLGSQKQDPALRDAQQMAAQDEANVLSPAPTPDVTSVARQMEPELFGHYEDLQAQRADLAAHPDQAGVQQHLAATEAQIAAVQPEVAAAYRRAADTVGGETVEPPAPEPVQSTQPAPEGQVPTEGATTAPSRETLDAEQAAIAQQVTANLIAAGRSPEEAAAGGQLLGHYYRTRSAKFQGALGSPLELFNEQSPEIRRYGASVAPLMPTEARPSIAKPIKTAPEVPSSGAKAPSSDIESLDPANIGVDASRFQFKAGGDEQGVSERLQGVEKWDPRLAGTALVFRDGDGRNWIADGHQRIGLANRLMEGGHPPIKVNAFVLDAKDGITEADARAIAAVKNIAEGTGTAVDAAKVIREAKATGIELPPLPPRSALVRDGNALAELSPEAFGIVVNEAVPFQQGAIVGRLVKNPAQQVEALRLLAAIKPENVTQAEMVVRDMLSSGTEMTTQGTLFGDEAFASSIVRERAKIADEALKLLRRDKATFRTLVDEAERIQGAGENVLDQAANQGRLSTDEQAADFLKQLAFRAGPVSDALSAVARKLKAGEIKPSEAARDFLGAVRGAVERGVAEGPDAGGSVAGAAGEQDVGSTFFQSRKPEPWREGEMFGGFDTERGLEGLPQTLIPGVKPLTDAERIAAEAAKPLKGGAAPAAKGSLFDEQGREDTAAQRELFQPAYHGSPHIFDKFSSDKIGTGEGAQAYGKGLYFASEKAIAQHYRNALAGPPTQAVLFDGKPVKNYRNIIQALDAAAKENPKHYDGAVKAFIEVASDAIRDGDKPKFDHLLRDRVSDIMSRVDNLRKRATDDEAEPPLASTYSPAQLRERADVEEARASAIKDAAARVTFEGKKQAGRLYHVEVPDEHELMDWDKRLGDQPAYVKEKLKGLGFVDEKPVRTTVGGLPVPEWMWSIRDDGKVPPQTGISDLIKPMQDAIAAHPNDANKAADQFLEEMKSPAFGTKGPLVEARLKAADVIANELRSANLRHGPAEAPVLDEMIPNDPALRSVLADIAKVEPDPQNWSMAVRDHPDLENRVWAWARNNPDATAGLQHPTADTIIDGVLSNYFYYQSLYNDFLRESGHGLTGKEIYEKLSNESGPAGASEKLREAGIPGHQYIGHESQKTNYVIYDDSRVNITQYEQLKRGALQLRPGRRNLLKLFQDADFSTFLHETGHQWLEDMMADAVHPAAPGALKDDALTVREALGMKPDQTVPTTRQHERWARWTEQYFREGVAPSPGLARVFAQFKTWLTQIYQSIKGLGSPISEDIRGVLDRMLAEEPNRTVIAPEQLERGPTLHDIHETEAQDVTPQQAGPISDRISAERDDYLARQPAEIRNELGTAIAAQEAERTARGGNEPPGEAGAGAEPGTAVGGAGSEPVPEPTGGTGGGEPSAVIGGGSEGLPEGANGPELRSNGPSVAGTARPLPPEPEPSINRAARFVDKAGNIRLDNINTIEDVKQVLRDMAAQNNEFIDYRRGKLNKMQILQLADAIGETDPDFFTRRRIGSAYSAEEIKYIERLMSQSAQVLAKAMKPGAGASPEEVKVYAEARSRHQMLQAHFSAATAEAGRALAALKRTQAFWSPEAAAADKAAREATGRTLFQLQDEMAKGAQLDTPEKVSRFMRDMTKKNAVDGILEYWISALLSGTKTWLVNDVSNFITSVNHIGPDIAAAALSGRIRKALGQGGSRVHFGEIGAAAQSATQKAIPVGVKALLDSWQAGKGVELPSQTEVAPLPFVEAAPDLFKGPQLDEGATYRELMPQVYGMVKGAVGAVIANGKLLASGGVAGTPLVSLRDTTTGVIPNVAIRGVTLPVGDAIRLPLRTLSSHDSLFRAANYTIEKSRTAYRTALEEGLTPGTQAFTRRVAQVEQNFTPDQMETAAETAQELTFMGRRGPFTRALVQLANSRPFNAPLPKFIVPFVSTPLAIIESAVVRRTPLAFLSPEVRADLMGNNGGVAQDMAIGRLMVGTLYGLAGAGMVSMGYLSGSGPQNPNDAAAWRMAGNQAHSVRVGDMNYQVNQLGSIGLYLSMVADAYHVAGALSHSDWGGVVGGLQQAFSQNVIDMSSLTGVSDLMQAVQDPERYGTSYVSKFLASFVPAISAQVAKSTDPYQRTAQGIIEAAQARVPFVSQDLPVRRDIYGESLPQNLPAGGFVYSAKVQTDPLNRAFMDGGYWPGYPDRTIRNVPLTETQYDLYSQVAGRTLRQNLSPIVLSSQWGTLSPEKKHDILSRAVTMSRETARNFMLARFPSLAIQAVRQKQLGLSNTP